MGISSSVEFAEREEATITATVARIAIGNGAHSRFRVGQHSITKREARREQVYALPSNDVPWSTPFPDPIPVDGKTLRTLQDCADYILNLPKKVSAEPHWQLAMEQLIDAAEGRIFLMFARIGMLRALNYGKPKADVQRSKRVKAYRIIR